MYHFLQLAVSHSFIKSVFDVPLAVCGAEIERKERETRMVKGGIIIGEGIKTFLELLKLR